MRRTHALTADDICEPTEEQLADDVTDGGGDLDTEILVGAELLGLVVDVAQHGGGDVDGKNIIAGLMGG